MNSNVILTYNNAFTLPTATKPESGVAGGHFDHDAAPPPVQRGIQLLIEGKS